MKFELPAMSGFDGIEIRDWMGGPVRDLFSIYIKTSMDMLRSAQGLEGSTLREVGQIARVQQAFMASINAMMSASGSSCTLDSPPEAINLTTDSDGNLVLRCEHDPCHEWDLDGTKI
ncbi:MAG: hypothetical protein KDE22_17135 [Rhodobacterales bacterium]|nr:hypothetical protein [Rhodobacterales bacterium]